MQFLGKFGKIVCWHPPPLESWRPLLGEILDPPLDGLNIDLGRTRVDAGFPKREAPTKGVDINLLFSHILLKKYMKAKKIGPKERGAQNFNM